MPVLLRSIEATADSHRKNLRLAAEAFAKTGAGCRIRTRDLRFTKPLLYQLS
jgi:hypothetical protein